MSQDRIPAVRLEITEPTVVWAIFAQMKATAASQDLPEVEAIQIRLSAQFTGPITAAQALVFKASLERHGAEYVSRMWQPVAFSS